MTLEQFIIGLKEISKTANLEDIKNFRLIFTFENHSRIEFPIDQTITELHTNKIIFQCNVKNNNLLEEKNIKEFN